MINLQSLTQLRKLSDILAENRGIKAPQDILADDEKYMCYVTLKSWGYNVEEHELNFNNVINIFKPSDIEVNDIRNELFKYLILGIPYDVLKECSYSSNTEGIRNRVLNKHLADKEFLKVVYAYSKPFTEYFKYESVKSKYGSIRKELLTPNKIPTNFAELNKSRSIDDFDTAFRRLAKHGRRSDIQPFDGILTAIIYKERDYSILQKPEMCDDYGDYAVKCLKEGKDLSNLADYNYKTIIKLLAENRKNGITRSELDFLNSLEPTCSNYNNLELLYKYPSISIDSVKDILDIKEFSELIDIAYKKDINKLLEDGWTIPELYYVSNAISLDDDDKIKPERIREFTALGKQGIEFLYLLDNSEHMKSNDTRIAYHYLLKGNYSIPITILAVFERYDKKDLDILLAENKDKTDLELISYLYDGKISLYNGEELVEMFRSFVNAFSRKNYHKNLWNSIYDLIDAYNDAFTYSPIIKERAYPQLYKEKEELEKEQAKQEEDSLELFIKEIQEQNKTSKLNI